MSPIEEYATVAKRIEWLYVINIYCFLNFGLFFLHLGIEGIWGGGGRRGVTWITLSLPRPPNQGELTTCCT